MVDRRRHIHVFHVGGDDVRNDAAIGHPYRLDLRAGSGETRGGVGYLLVWAGFSLLATAANWSLHTGGLMSSIMGNVGPQTGGLFLVAAGGFQFTPLKNACLDHCRSPMSFLMHHWREGSSGAVFMGLHHGIYCLGCCWFLMLLLFVLGVMNLPWVALLTIIVLVEKVMPRGEILCRGLGVLLIGWGAWLIIAG